MISEGGILWEISKDGNEKKSYLLGTFHGSSKTDIDYTYLDTLQVYKKILDYVDAIGVECDISDSIFEKFAVEDMHNYIKLKKYPSYAYLPDSINSFASIFKDTAQFNFVNNFIYEFKKQDNIPSFSHYQLKPVFIINLLKLYGRGAESIKEKKENKMVMDYGIINHAKSINKPLLYMESTSYQYKLIKNLDSILVTIFDIPMQAEYLYKYCRDYEKENDYIKKLKELYIKDDLSGTELTREKYITEEIKWINHPGYTEIINELHYERNYNWIPLIKEYTEKRSCLIAVGLLHLPGKKGLINLLRKEGYRVEPVDLHSSQINNQKAIKVSTPIAQELK